MMRKALKPVKRRIRLLRAAGGLVIGFLLAAGACLGLSGAAFLVPMEAQGKWMLLAAFASLLIPPVIGLLLPAPLLYVARRADRCGLKERAVTALAFQGREGAMLHLQRQDAVTCLSALPLREKMPLRPNRRMLAAGLLLLLLTGALQLIPNPQHDILTARRQARQRLAAQAETLEKAAERLEDQSLTEEERRELRRITGEMSKALREAKDDRDALTRLSEQQKQLERLSKEIERRNRSETAAALGTQSALKALAGAMEGENAEAMQEALEALAQEVEQAQAGESIAGQLTEAASLLASGPVQQGLLSGAAAAAAGNGQMMAQALSGALSGSAMQGTDLSGLARMARAGMGGGQGSGQGAGAGGQGQGAGGGAGLGTTQQDQGYSQGGRASSQGEGTGAPRDRVGEYERIYDPTRLGGDGEISQVEGEKAEGQSQQIQLSPSLGDLSGHVPYDQVIGEYSQAAGQAVRRAALPEALQSWVTRYFDALID